MPQNLEIYKASAGSGKTYTLTRKYLSYLFSPDTSHRNILAVTFTNKATEEMKSRILKELYLISIESKDSDHIDFFCKQLNETKKDLAKRAKDVLKKLLNEYSGFFISTIDRFFLSIIQTFTQEMSLNGNYNIELDTDRILEEAIENMLVNLEREENKQLLDWLKTYTEELINNEKSWNPVTSISELGKELFKEVFKNQNHKLASIIKDKEKLASIQKEFKNIQNEFEKKIDEIIKNIKNLLKSNGLKQDDFAFGKSSFIANALNIKSKNYEIGKRLKEAIEANDAEKWVTKKTSKDIKNKIANIYTSLKEILEKLLNHITNNIKEYNTAVAINKNIYNLGILSDIDKEIGEIVKKEHLLLLSNATEFLSKIIKSSDSPFIYEKIGSRLNHFMIDEFQDTSTLQWNNFRPLLQETLSQGKGNMLVGDVKQSIYRWRNSDWDLLNTQLKNSEENKGIQPYIEDKNLDTNYRSCKNVILFNNTFFTLTAKEISTFFTDEFKQKIETAYKDVIQKVGKSNETDGYVSVQFLEDSSLEKTLAIMTKRISSLIKNGNSLSDIAILVRENKEATIVAEHLLQEGYKILSNEALKIKNSKSVQFIIAFLTYFISPNNLENKFLLLQRYFLLIEKSEKPLFNAIQAITNNKEIKEITGLDSLEKGSLFEQAENLIHHFKLIEKCPKEIAFIQAMQDVIFDYETKKGSDLSKFLTFWTEAKNLNLNVPKSADAIKILTIHASKGLELKNVIIPFFNWTLEPKANTRIWCSTQNLNSPFNKIPIVPMAYNTTMNNSLFESDYQHEKMLSYIDALNVTYVAFTRACEELHIIAPIENNEKTLHSILRKIIERDNLKNDNVISFKQEMVKIEDGIFTLGSPMIKGREKEIPKNENNLSYSTQKKYEYNLTNKGEKWVVSQNKRTKTNYGILMHELLSKVKYEKDIDATINLFEKEGRITKDEAAELKKKINNFIEKHNIHDWFSDKYKILNEIKILQKNDNIRLDRVLIKDKHAIVIDYKFGRKSDEYKEQVEKYMSKIEQMGYTTEGYLCYIEEDSIEKV